MAQHTMDTRTCTAQHTSPGGHSKRGLRVMQCRDRAQETPRKQHTRCKTPERMEWRPSEEEAGWVSHGTCESLQTSMPGSIVRGPRCVAM